MSFKRQIVELHDRYIIPIENRVVSRCYVDTALGIQFFEDGPETTLRVEGTLILTISNKIQEYKASKPENLGNVCELVGVSVISAFAYKSGKLELRFSNETHLLVNSDPDYESWEISGKDGLQLVSLPGKGVAVWQASE